MSLAHIDEPPPHPAYPTANEPPTEEVPLQEYGANSVDTTETASDPSLSGGWIANHLYKRKTYAIAIFISIAGIGMIWSTQGNLLDELHLNISSEMKTLGYVLTVLRLGKVLGHLSIVPINNIFGGRLVEVHIVAFMITTVLTACIPVCTGWLTLSLNWLALGAMCGFIESNILMINEILNGPERIKFTNVYYALYSIGSVFSANVVDKVKHHTTGYVHTVTKSYTQIAFCIALLIVPAIIMLMVRRRKGMIVLESTCQHDEQVAAGIRRRTEFHFPRFSYPLLWSSAFLFVACQSCLGVYTLTFAENSSLELTHHEAYFVSQFLLVSVMLVRIIVSFIAFFYQDTVVGMATCNTLVATASVLFAILQDQNYFLVMAMMLLYGFGIGLFQITLLNWLTDHVVLTAKNSFPFFLASTLGMVATPALVPQIVFKTVTEDGVETEDFIVVNYVWVVVVLGFVAVVLSTVLMILESDWFAKVLHKEDEVLGTASTITIGTMKRSTYNIDPATSLMSSLC